MTRKLLIVPVLALALFGCNQADKDRATADGQRALASAGKAVGSAWASVSAEAGKLSQRSSMEALESARKKMGEVQAQLSSMKVENPIDMAKVEEVKLQVQRLDAAIMVQDLRKQSDEALKSAIETKKVAETNLEDAKLKLRQIDATYKDLDDKRKSAERTYNEANSMWSAAMQRLQSFTKGNL